MTGFLEILSAGFQSSIQDMGRWGYQEYGIPTCGSVTPHWMELGNTLVGNPASTAGIEFRAIGLILRAITSPVKLAICGDISAEIINSSYAGTQIRKVKGWRSFTLIPDEELKISRLENSATGFIAVSGGFALKKDMNSLSTYVRSQIGGLAGVLLKTGDKIPLGEKASKLACQPDRLYPSPLQNNKTTVRVVLGPQAEYFEEKSLQEFQKSVYEITTDTDRMGARLHGTQLNHKKDKGSEIISDGVVPGTIQVPGTGQPIVLLNDGQTVGGYPKIATIISTDLHIIANALPGTNIRFKAVSALEACLIARDQRKILEQMKKTILGASADRFIDLKALYETNLIGGMIDMAEPSHFPGHLEELKHD